MYYCPKCNVTSEMEMRFCPQCGAPAMEMPTPAAPVVEAAQPIVEPVVETVAEPVVETVAEPAVEPVVPAAPVAPVAPVAVVIPPVEEKKPPHLALKIVSMALSIGGLVFAAIGNLYALIFGFIEEGMGLGMAIGFGMFSLPLAIVGLSLANKCLAAGDTSAMSRIGRTLGIVGIIATAAGVMLGFMTLFAFI